MYFILLPNKTIVAFFDNLKNIDFSLLIWTQEPLNKHVQKQHFYYICISTAIAAYRYMFDSMFIFYIIELKK